MRRQGLSWWLGLLCALAVGCGSDPPAMTPDTGTVDSGGGDTEDTGSLGDTDNDAADTGMMQDMPPMCSLGQTLCEGACVDTQSTNAHCGRCGNACPAGQSCRMGMCAMGTTCLGAETECSGRCVNTAADPMNCGRCGNACATGEVCRGGTCAPAMMCSMGQLDCGAGCTDTMTDAMHCGRCRNACMAGQSCAGGTCMGMAGCTGGRTSCGGACVDTMTDAMHCGRCDNACAAGMACAAGACGACSGGRMVCGGTCVDTMTDAMHCGGCGRACAAGQSCAAGMCTGMMTCGAGQTRCGEACVNTMTDAAHCGRCDNACTAGMVCAAGACGMGMELCMAGQTRCGMACVSTDTDRANCGMCGRACPGAQVCAGGSCGCAAGATLCGAACVNTMTDDGNCGMCGRACPMGQRCMAGTCALVCGAGEMVCGAACVNTSTDRANCGRCGNACPAGQGCVAGACACPAGSTSCMGVCVNLQTSNSNCGACGTVCMGGQTCAMGRCGCNAPNTMCGARCVNTMTDTTNCGRCGNACPRGQTCSGAMCRSAMAPSNDERSGATRIDVAMPSVTLTTNTNNARNDTAGPAGCSCTSGNDVFYTFTLTQPELVYADSLGSGYDASLFLQNAAGMNLTDAGTAGGATCDDDDGFCGTGNQAQIVARLPAGTYFLVLSGCGAGAGTIHFQHLPAGNGASNRITPRGAEQMVMGTTSGAGTVTSACCSGGPENSYWFLTCATTAPVQFYASTCGGATFDTELEQRSAGRTPVTACNDDVGAAFACGQRSSLNSTIPAGTGLHTLLLDSCSGSGVYNITYSVGTCAAGQTWCGACFDTLNDVRHCGGCNRACAAGNNCIAGVCRTAPANDNRAGATLVSLAAAAVTLTGDTSAATHDAPGSCGCTTRGADVWFRFVLTQREYVYADTIGATWDTALLFANASGAVVPSSNLALGQTCDDNDGLTGCATGMQSQILARLDPGTYYLVLSGCGRGSAAVHFHHLPTGNGLTRFLAATEGAGYDGTTAGTGTVTATCCSNGPEDSFYWYTCGSFRGGAFTAQTCGRATWDTELDQRSATRSTVSACSDDACGRRSSLASTIPVGAGLHALYVDGCVATVSGNVGAGRYGVFITRP